MRTMIFLIATLFSVALFAQHPLDTIYANEKKTVALFFPKPIRQGIVGKQHFVFNYNKEEAQHVGLLQATPGVESNLLAITDDGQVYSYILKYADRLSTLNYFIKDTESIGNEIPPVKKLEEAINRPIFLKESERHRYKKNSLELLSKVKVPMMYAKSKGYIKLTVKDIIFRDRVLYFLLGISNTSVLDYELNYINFFMANNVRLKKSSFQKIYLPIIYSHGLPTVIKGNSRADFVMVFPKFSVDRSKKIGIELNELHGERNITLRLPSGFINRIKR
ncbi:MAG: conjugative transposon protein TraN [Flavobacteriaceae bacterium]|nr:conjugative transposon protein TraN [Flavobacteriaceae bacterium]